MKDFLHANEFNVKWMYGASRYWPWWASLVVVANPRTRTLNGELRGVEYNLVADPKTKTLDGFVLNEKRYQTIPMRDKTTFRLSTDCNIEVQLPVAISYLLCL